MSLAITLSQKLYVGNGAQTAYPTGFSFESNSDLIVQVTSAGGVFVTKALGADYSVTGAGAAEPGGTVTFVAAPANGALVQITRSTPRTQPIAFPSQGDFLPATHERAFDHEERQTQELERRVAALEAGAPAAIIAGAVVVTKTFTPFADPPENNFPVNVASTGTPTAVLLARVEDLTDGTTIHYALTPVDWGSPIFGQFTLKFLGGLTPGHVVRASFVVFIS